MSDKKSNLKGKPKKSHMSKVTDKLVNIHKTNEKLREKKIDTSFFKLFK